MRFTNAIVRLPCKRMTEGLSSASSGKPDHSLALSQHGKYVEALHACGLDVRVLPADENHPDSTFVEDTALLTPEFALLTFPGAPSRQGEIINMKKVLHDYYSGLEIIRPPGTLEAGDVMMVGDHYFIGLSERTNSEGGEQLISLLQDHGMSGSVVEFSGMLHLKSGISYLENNTLLAIESFSRHPVFSSFNTIPVPDK